jgi:two-component system, OmpR family, sensor kinase
VSAVALRDLLRSRLALRIYLVGLAQMAVVAIGFFALWAIDRPPGGGPLPGQARLVARALTPLVADPRALEGELSRVRDDLRASVTVFDPDGNVVATTPPRLGPGPGRGRGHGPGGPGDGPGGPRHGDARGPGPPGAPPNAERHSADLPFPDGRLGRIELMGPGRPPPPLRPSIIAFVLLVVGVSSWLLAQNLTRPLERLSTTARALGGGNLGARAALSRGDELGDVARAFDDMAERLSELLRAEKELLANVSHELRTPLARIRVALDLAAEGDAEQARESLAEIGGDLEELERLISDVLAAARLDLADGSTASTGAPPLRRQRVDVGELLALSASRFRAAHPERVLREDVAPGLPPIDGDPVLLRRVVDNLLENAHKYTERADDAVELRARLDDGLSIEVADRGVGIAPDDLARVFRPFFRADKSRTRKTGGLGLGLALAKRIVDAHGGTITLESTPGLGTLARVKLPTP